MFTGNSDEGGPARGSGEQDSEWEQMLRQAGIQSREEPGYPGDLAADVQKHVERRLAGPSLNKSSSGATSSPVFAVPWVAAAVGFCLLSGLGIWYLWSADSVRKGDFQAGSSRIVRESVAANASKSMRVEYLFSEARLSLGQAQELYSVRRSVAPSRFATQLRQGETRSRQKLFGWPIAAVAGVKESNEVGNPANEKSATAPVAAGSSQLSNFKYIVPWLGRGAASAARSFFAEIDAKRIRQQRSISSRFGQWDLLFGGDRLQRRQARQAAGRWAVAYERSVLPVPDVVDEQTAIAGAESPAESEPAEVAEGTPVKTGKPGDGQNEQDLARTEASASKVNFARNSLSNSRIERLRMRSLFSPIHRQSESNSLPVEVRLDRRERRPTRYDFEKYEYSYEIY